MNARARLLAPLLLVACLGPVQASEVKRALDQARAAAAQGDAAALQKALAVVGAEGGRTAAKGLLELVYRFPEGQEPLYWQVLSTLGGLSDRAGLDAVADFLSGQGELPLARDLLLALQGNRADEVLGVYERLLRPKRGPLQVDAVDRLGELERADAVDLLLEVLEREEGSGSALERRVRTTLTALFGQDMGDRLNWVGFWAQNRETFFQQARREGATGTVKDQLDRARGGALSSMSRRGGEVLVVRGTTQNFDEIEEVLEKLGVKHRVPTKAALNEDPEQLERAAALILNCSYFGDVCTCPNCKAGEDPRSRLPVCTGCTEHVLTPDQLSDETIARIKTWVAQGGCVFTEDFGLKELTSKAWPEWVRAGSDLSAGDVDYAPGRGLRDLSLLRGVLVGAKGAGATSTRRTSRWKVDDLSPSIVVVDPERVQVLLTSQELTQASPEKAGAVAIAFSPEERTTTAPGPRRARTGRGRSSSGRGDRSEVARPGLVLHVLSHFGKQQDVADEMTLQNLLVNFLLTAQDRFAQRSGRR